MQRRSPIHLLWLATTLGPVSKKTLIKTLFGLSVILSSNLHYNGSNAFAFLFLTQKTKSFTKPSQFVPAERQIPSMLLSSKNIEKIFLLNAEKITLVAQFQSRKRNKDGWQHLRYLPARKQWIC